MKTKIRDANSKLTEWIASLHGAWARKLWACVGWQITWGKCHATFAFSLYFSLGVHFWSLLATWLLAGWAFSWSWHKCFLSLCKVGAHLLGFVSTAPSNTGSWPTSLWYCMDGEAGERFQWNCSCSWLLSLANLCCSRPEISCISDHNGFALLLIVFSLLDCSVPWWLPLISDSTALCYK